MQKKSNKMIEGLVMVLIGCIIICCGLYIYFIAHTIYPNSDSNRVQDLNWLLKTFGKTGTAAIFGAIGLICLYGGLKKIIR